MAEILTIYYLITQSFYFRIVSSSSREVTWLCFSVQATSPDAKFIASHSKAAIGREFHTLPEVSMESYIKHKNLPAAGIGEVTLGFYAVTCISDIGISWGTFPWRPRCPLEGLWCRTSGLSSARVSPKRLLAPAWCIILDSYTAQTQLLCSTSEVPLSPQYHIIHLNINSLGVSLKKKNFQVPPPSLISPITLTALPQQGKKQKQKPL